MCVCMCLFVCVFVCVYKYMCVCVFVCVCVCVCVLGGGAYLSKQWVALAVGVCWCLLQYVQLSL